MEDKGEVIGPKGIINKHELIRIITQCLYSLGYVKSANCLESESCIPCKSPELKSLELQVQNAEWDDCVDSLTKINELTNEARVSALLLVYEQYLLECFKNRGTSVALDVLRKKVARSVIGKDNVMKLSYKFLLMEETDITCIDHDLVLELRKKLLSQLEEVLPPPISLPKRRLELLIERAVCHQIESCDYHLLSDMVSLYKDHDCCQDAFPTETIQVGL